MLAGETRFQILKGCSLIEFNVFRVGGDNISEIITISNEYLHLNAHFLIS